VGYAITVHAEAIDPFESSTWEPSVTPRCIRQTASPKTVIFK